MNFELYIERIGQYESGALTDADRAAFERELAESSELQEALALYRQANEVIEQQIDNKLRAQLRQWAAEDASSAATETRSGGRVVSMNRLWVRWAAAAAVTLLIGWFGLHWAGNRYTDEALFAAYYEKPETSVFRTGTVGEHPLQPGFDALTAGNDEAAATFFDNIPAENERYTEAQYYLGHTAAHLKQYDTAIAAFRRCIDRNEPKFREKAEWNLALAYVAAGRADDPAFRSLLARVVQSGQHSYHTEAKELQDKLKSVWRQIVTN